MTIIYFSAILKMFQERTERKDSNMNKTYISITITYFCDGPDVHYYQNDGIHPVVTSRNKLTANEANVLMWKLVKRGGENSYRTNMFNPHLHTRKVEFYGYL